MPRIIQPIELPEVNIDDNQIKDHVYLPPCKFKLQKTLVIGLEGVLCALNVKSRPYGWLDYDAKIVNDNQEDGECYSRVTMRPGAKCFLQQAS